MVSLAVRSTPEDRRRQGARAPDRSPLAGLLAAASTSRRLRDFLDEAGRHAADLLAADAVAISRLTGDTLIDAGTYSAPGTPPVDDGLLFLLEEYPATRRVVSTGVPEIASLHDPRVDRAEASMLWQYGFAAVLEFSLVVDSRPWGLVEIFRRGTARFDERDVASGLLYVSELGRLLADVEQNTRVRRIYDEALASVRDALRTRRWPAYAHSERVSALALAVGVRLGLSGTELDDLELGARLHDIGKLRLPDSILNKRDGLTRKEWRAVEEHPAVGAEMLASVPALRGARPIIRSHHERWDGRGYPDGLAGTAIPLGARIVTACDAFAAMSETRPYRRRLTRHEIAAELRRGVGTQFDPQIAGLLLDVADTAPERIPRGGASMGRSGHVALQAAPALQP